ncbi:MAG: CHAT domain-containing protein [Roseiflexaceae bacterium]
MSYADLELNLHRRDADTYAVEMRFTQPDSDADVRLMAEAALVRFDTTRLRELSADAVAYGQALSASLFAEQAVAIAFAQARASAQSLDVPLRLRLFIGPSAPELHGLRWETLRDPQDGSALLMGEQIFFSRYLSSGDWRPVRLRPKGQLRVLVAIANPSDLGRYNLAALDVPAELERARTGLGDMPRVDLDSGGKATLNNLIEQLREGPDILYLVCHGALLRGEPVLWLEDEAGATARVPGAELVARLKELQERPRLAVLVSCQSAGAGEGALAALGPRLAEAGIPAVLAMQGNVTIETMATFLPTFFKALQSDGQIDRAVALARGAVRERFDTWMPALFMRLKSGRIWYVPGFGDDRRAFEKWPSLLRFIRRGQCTPIIGTHLSEELLGTSQEIARRWAETYHFPMAPHEREDLPQVAQFLSVEQDPRFPHEELVEYLRGEILDHYGPDLPAELAGATLGELFAALFAQRREHNPADPYKVLADLPFPVYITTNASNMLTEALRAAGKDPQVELCRWNQDIELLPSIYDDEPDYQPSEQRPLVYHLFGTFDEPISMVLTEDDHFDFLIGVSTNKELIPITVRQALADTALLFLGFRLDDWNFRVLFRSIMSQEGGSRRSRYAHIAGQIMPEEGRFLEPERARRYLESYFRDVDISIFWGSVEDFTKELLAQWQAEADKPTARRR